MGLLNENVHGGKEMKTGRKWNKKDEDIIAQIFLHENIKRSDIIVSPGEMLVLIKNGRIVDTVTQTRINSVKGGLLELLKSIIGREQDIEIMYVDTGEKRFVIGFGENKGTIPYTKDHDVVNGTSSMMFRIDPQNVVKLYSHVKNTSDRILTTMDIKRIVRREVLDRVLVPRLMEYQTSSIGKIEVIEDIENSLNREVGQYLERFGINLLNFTTRFGTTAEELLNQRMRGKGLDIKEEVMSREMDIRKDSDIYGIGVDGFERKETRFDNYKDGKVQRDLKDIERGSSINEAKIRSDFMGKKIQQDSEHLLEKGELGHRISLEEETADHAITLADKKAKKTAIERVEDEEDWKLFMKMEKDETGLELEKKQKESEIKIREFEGTDFRLKELELEKEKIWAMTEAQKAKYNAELIEKAWDKADRKTGDMMDKMANIIHAGKKNVPHTYVQGAGQVSTRLDIESNEGKKICPACQAENPLDSDVCTECDERLD